MGSGSPLRAHTHGRQQTLERLTQCTHVVLALNLKLTIQRGIRLARCKNESEIVHNSLSLDLTQCIRCRGQMGEMVVNTFYDCFIKISIFSQQSVGRLVGWVWRVIHAPSTTLLARSLARSHQFMICANCFVFMFEDKFSEAVFPFISR